MTKRNTRLRLVPDDKKKAKKGTRRGASVGLGYIIHPSFDPESGCLNEMAINAIYELGGVGTELSERYHMDRRGVSEHLDECENCRKKTHFD